MPGMMHHNCSRGCCPRGSRTEDKRTLAHWVDEYETNPEIEHRFCPKGGDLCTCDGGDV